MNRGEWSYIHMYSIIDDLYHGDIKKNCDRKIIHYINPIFHHIIPLLIICALRLIKFYRTRKTHHLNFKYNYTKYRMT